ncbi:hypothetical protein FNV43_RR11348 [Rhamnella rubrinervis]|uniref:Folate-biopterin transporter 2 n=1 Tax=Rhamnella rubrinervis TaxID=2594499 RepID=A0A8K0H5U4_9ROSA|nr:hypothetical protein FNV43_RR11348 [Rhamnella rubrinervis]
MVEDEEEEINSSGTVEENDPRKSCCDLLFAPIQWLKMLALEMHWSFVFGVVVVYGISQGLGGALSRVGTEYYMKDVQKVQPSEAQIFKELLLFPGLSSLYGVSSLMFSQFLGSLGVISMLILSLHEKLHLAFALLSLTAASAGAAIADVTIDACVAQNSISHPSLAADMQSLCALSSSIGALVGFSISGIFVHLIGPMGMFGLLAIPFGLVLVVGILLDEPHVPDFSYSQVNQKFVDAGNAMWTTLKFPNVWRPCLYMYLSFALSLNVAEGMFYWYTDSKNGPGFSKEQIGFKFSIGSVGSLLGAILYQNVLKDHPFRDLLFWTQLLYGLSGMLDLMLVLRLNLKFGVPDYFFAVIDESVSQLIGRLKWMPLLVLSSKLCPSGIEGTFFALLMSIDNVGLLSSTWGGGILLHILKVTRTQFDNLWLAILIRNILRVTPLCMLFLVPRADPNSSVLPAEILGTEEEIDSLETKNIELLSLVNSVDNDR